MLVQLIYVSVPAIDVAEATAQFLINAQHKNKLEGISGMLISSPKFYIQIIEGDREAVNTLFNKICNDPRHTKPTIVRYCETRSREFEDWSMLHISFNELQSHFVAAIIKHEHITPERLSGVSALSVIRRLAAIIRVRGEVPLIDDHTIFSKSPSDFGVSSNTDTQVD
jgi:hypothetical protein